MKKLWVLVVLLAGCGVVVDTEIKAAVNACVPHNGVRYMYFVLGNGYDTICHDGTRIEGKVQR